MQRKHMRNNLGRRIRKAEGHNPGKGPARSNPHSKMDGRRKNTSHRRGTIQPWLVAASQVNVLDIDLSSRLAQ